MLAARAIDPIMSQSLPIRRKAELPAGTRAAATVYRRYWIVIFFTNDSELEANYAAIMRPVSYDDSFANSVAENVADRNE